MAFAFGGIETFAVIGSLLVGLVIIAFFSDKLGVTGALHAFINALGHFLNLLGRILSFAPGWLKVLFFAVVGAIFVGTAVNWIFAADVVCVGTQPYVAPSYLSGVFAKSMSVDGVSQPSLAGFLTDPFGSQPGFRKFGTFLTIAGDTDVQTSIDRVVPENLVTERAMILAVPETMNLSEESGVVISKNSIFSLTAKKADLYICSPTFLSPPGEITGQCYLREPNRLLGTISLGCGLDSQIAHVQYSFVTEDTSVGLATKLNIIVESSQDNWDMCGQAAGTVLLKPEALQTFSSDIAQAQFSTSTINLTGYQGWVHAKYAGLGELEVGELLSGGSRKDFVTAEGSGFAKKSRATGDVLTYSCSVDQDVEMGLWGVKVFNWTALLVLITIGGLLGLMKALNLL